MIFVMKVQAQYSIGENQISIVRQIVSRKCGTILHAKNANNNYDDVEWKLGRQN